MLQSLTSVYSSTCFSAVKYACASAGARISGSETISISGTPHAVEIDVAVLVRIREALVQIFRRIFFHVQPRDPDAFLFAPSISISSQPPVASGSSYIEIW